MAVSIGARDMRLVGEVPVEVARPIGSGQGEESLLERLLLRRALGREPVRCDGTRERRRGGRRLLLRNERPGRQRRSGNQNKEPLYFKSHP